MVAEAVRWVALAAEAWVRWAEEVPREVAMDTSRATAAVVRVV
jgi:hypothetical protein